MVMPKEVEEAAAYLGKEQFRARTEEDISEEMYSRGYETGKKFDPTKTLAGGVAT